MSQEPKLLTYVFTPRWMHQWGEMQIVLVTRAPSFFDAQDQVVDELEKWKKSQTELNRTDYPWLDEAITILGNKDVSASAIFGLPSNTTTKVELFWFDEREPLAK